jgi:hypothetical protein
MTLHKLCYEHRCINYIINVKTIIHTVCTYSLLMNLPFNSEHVSLNTRFR